MTCHDVQLQLSLYLYGELDFAAEERVENHLSECAFCQRAFAREKTWHTAASAEHRDVSLDLLAECRRELRTLIATEAAAGKRSSRKSWQWPSALRVSFTPWSYRLAAASFLVFVGFAAGRFVQGLGSGSDMNLNQAGMFDPSTRIRDIQADGPGRVRIVLDQVKQREVVGNANDQNVRQWLLVAIQDPSDPGIRVDSMDMLSKQTGTDVRDALLGRIQRDPNAAVRLKALESVRPFASDATTRSVLRSVLEHDTDPNVRSEAIDVLAPVNQKPELTPELAMTLQNLVRSENDDYVRERCLQLLRAINAPTDVY